MPLAVAFLDELLSRLADVAAEDQPAIIHQLLNDNPDITPQDLSAEVLTKYDALTDGDAPASEDTLHTLETLARVAEGVGELNARAEERTQRAHEIGEQLRNLAPQTPADDNPHDGDNASDNPAGETPADDTTPAPEPQSPAPAAPAPAATPEPVAAAVTTDARVPLGQIPSSAPPQTETRNAFESFSLVAAADVPEFATGQKMDGLGDLARAWEHRMGPMITGNINSGRDGERTRVGLARIRRDVPDAFTINDDSEALDKIRHATDETRLPGGSLVASAGWCAPSETLYDLCPVRMTDEGIISLPSVTARRGGVRYPADPDWSAVWGSIHYLTETEVIAGVEKTCLEVPCPTDFQECRMEPAHLCVRTPLLMERGWPERIEHFMQGVLRVHAHKMNSRKLARMEELSTRVIYPRPGEPDPTTAIPDAHGPGMVESILSQIELQVQYQRYRDRLSQTATLEMVAPYWLRGIMKSDLRKKLGIDNRWSISDASLDTYLRNVGVNPQWVYDWQDALASGDPSDFGGELPTTWPDTVKVLIYPAGTFFQLQADVINLDGVYDHASLVKNIYTGLFTEEGWQVCNRCGTSYVLEMPVCPNGLSGSHQSVTCTAPELV